ncbi:MAG: caspase family protein [Bacteroidota bacterium]|nr:caspase family protein [Bacteroidota bacterium]
MKKSFPLFLVFSLFIYGSVQAQTKRALIVAIGNYDFAKTKWSQINVDNDILLIQEALAKQNFPSQNITVLKHEAATRDGIEKALDKLAQSSGAGDVVVIHFSSHGQQLEDDGDDEMDKLDEAIVPYDAVYNSNPVEFQKYAPGYFRDDKFGEKVTAIRNNLGSKGDLLVLLDACHSGTGTRGPGTAVVRGSKAPMVSSKFDGKNAPAKDEAGVFKEGTKLKLKSDAATYVVLSGAQAQELNYETIDENRKAVGSLSYAFSKALSTLEGTTSYRSLFASIESIMREKSPKQKPVLEGDGTDRELFGGKYIKQKAYFTVMPAKSNKDVIEINGGTVSGVTVGSVVSFYPAGTADPSDKQPLQKGTVTTVRNFSSSVKLSKPDLELFKKSPWAFVTELSYGNKKIKLKVNNSIPGAAAQVQTAFKDFQLVELNSNGGLYLDTSGSADAWIYKYANSGISFGTETFSLSDTATMKETLKRFDRFQYLQNLKFNEQGLSAKVEIVFLDDNKNVDYTKLASRTKLTGLELKEGDEVFLKITNTGDKKFFINVVDVQPDGKINPVLPNKNLKDKDGYPAPVRAEDCTVNKGDSLLLKNLSIKIWPPYGEETLKVFLSGEKLDLEDILTDDANDGQSRGAGGVLNNMAKIFKNSKVNGSGTRGTETKVNTAQNGTIFSVGFNIVPAN